MVESAERALERLTAELAAARAHNTALRQSLDAHRRLLENARDMVWRTDLDGKVLYVNGYAEEFLERPAALVLGHTMDAYFTAASVRDVLKGVRETLLAKPPLPFLQCEVEYRHRDGHHVPAEIRITAERNAAGRIVAFSGISRSIADRRRAEVALNAQRAFFEQLFTQSCVSTQILDKDGWCERINPKLTELFGVQPEHIEGRLYNIWKDEGIRQAGVIPHLERVFREGKIAEWEVLFDIGLAAESQGIEVREKTRRWFHNWAYPIFDESGTLSHVIVQHADITDRKRADEALAASEQRFRILFERSPDALLILSPPSWSFTSANPAALAMFGVEHESSFASLGPEHFSPARQPDGRASLEKSLEMGEIAMRSGTHSFEWTHRRASGEDFPATVVLARFELDGQPQLQAIVRDETEKRRLQASMAQADRLATMGMLAAGVAHEINNPLAYVLASVEALAQALPKVADPAVNDELLDAAARALEGTRRIAGIARGLGIFARVERDEVTSVELSRVLEGAAAMANNEIKYRATLVWELGEVPPIWASEGKLSQVFLNLLINAAHAMPEGDAAVQSIHVRTWTSNGDVFAEIRDTGVGIPPENLERIFEPFFTTKKVGQGSGLGLAICKTLLAEHLGGLHVESDLGRGTRVVVRLPIRGNGSGEHAQHQSTNKRESMQPGVRGRVLVVDDEEHIRAVMTRMLKHDHDVVAVASGREAEALLQDDTAFDVILCDVMMPDISGIELHTRLLRRDAALAAKLVFVSGGAFAAGASDYLLGIPNRQIAKPFETKLLRKLVAELVAEARAAG